MRAVDVKMRLACRNNERAIRLFVLHPNRDIDPSDGRRESLPTV